MSIKLIYSDAKFSKDRIYRYALWRIWDDTLPKLLFIGLNPSTADETNDDPTMRRCIRFSKDLASPFLQFVFNFSFSINNTYKSVSRKIKYSRGNR